MQDKTITCISCSQEFVFNAAEQEFFKIRGFKNEPKRCKKCLSKRSGKKSPGKEVPVTCAQCGQNTTVPFKPVTGKPVFCRPCFQGLQHV